MSRPPEDSKMTGGAPRTFSAAAKRILTKEESCGSTQGKEEATVCNNLEAPGDFLAPE